jgi:RNA polymerase sigma factor (sigma-70 family)
MAEVEIVRATQLMPDEDFRAFYGEHFGEVYRYTARRAAAADVDGLVADVFVVAWRRFADLPLSDHERTLWLFGVSRRVMADNRKAATRRDRLRQRLGSGERGQAAHDVPGSSVGPESAEADLAIRVLAELRPRDREALRLVLWEQLNHAEVADVLGCSVNAVAIRLHRARRKMTSRYAELARQETQDGGARTRPVSRKKAP